MDEVIPGNVFSKVIKVVFCSNNDLMTILDESTNSKGTETFLYREISLLYKFESMVNESEAFLWLKLAISLENKREA